MMKHIGFVSTRFSGTDGVSLEACKWADVFEQNGHRCFWFAGEIDRNVQKSFEVPEAHFKHEQNRWINEQILGTKQRRPLVTQVIHDLRSLLKARLHQFINQFDIDLLIAENVLTIPMHVPFGLALTETIAETQLPTISHNHDFYWERVRFSRNAVSDYLRMAFPPGLPNIKHVVINSDAQEQLALRTGVSSTIIPNVLNFERPPDPDEDGILAFRESIGLSPEDRMILQPTRIVKRKGIESAIELLKELDDSRNKLVISHEAGDEGYEYAEWLKHYACENRVDLRLVSGHISDPWTRKLPGKSAYTLWDIYPYADFITYPSRYEGFGNAFLEAIYFKKPLLINRYATFVRDIEPIGFELVTMDGYLSKETVREVRTILDASEKRQKMVDLNYRLATRHYSYSVLRGQLNGLLGAFFGDGVRPLREPCQTPGCDDILHIEPHALSSELYNAENGRLSVGTSS
ncbi:Glycosyltransferase [Olavius algarvensis associated proteobacterium Delta 3]|nr:Glycosyltransferase [Olavius algarvensis associated proteobacterium Delta 3]